MESLGLGCRIRAPGLRPHSHDRVWGRLEYCCVQFVQSLVNRISATRFRVYISTRRVFCMRKSRF